MVGWAKNEFQKSSWKMAESKGGEVNCEPNAKILKEWGNLPSKIRDDSNKKAVYAFYCTWVKGMDLGRVRTMPAF